MNVDILTALEDNYIHLVSENGIAVAVDPSDPRPVIEALRRRSSVLAGILVTHHHGDHTAGCAALRSLTGCEIVGPADPRLPGITRSAGDGDRLQLGPFAFTAIAVPGHTRTHLAYHLPAGAAVWTGDCLFACGCGRIIEGTPGEMWTSVQRLTALPETTRVYCGHDYTLENIRFALQLEPDNKLLLKRRADRQTRAGKEHQHDPSTMALEKATNPFCRADSPGLARAVGMPDATPAQIFAEIRSRKDRFR